MKKMVIILLTIAMLLSLFACNNNSTPDIAPTSASEATPEPSAIEQLGANDKLLYDALIKITKKDFYEPSKIRIMEVGDYSHRAPLSGTDSVVVRLQGENKVGGTLNHYYLVVVKKGEYTDETGQTLISYYEATGNLKGLYSYKGDVGDYAELDDNYEIEKDASSTFNIGKINKALAQYWEDLGF